MASFQRLLLWLYSPFLLLVLALMATAVFFLVQAGLAIFTCGLLLIPVIGLLIVNVLQVLWACRVLLNRPPEMKELILSLPRKRYPALYKWVEEIARQRRVPAPHELRLDADEVAYVFENDEGRAVLGLGAQAVALFSQAALAGVVAHELGHIAAGDIRLSRRALRPVILMHVLDEHFRRRRWSFCNPFLWLLWTYHWVYRLVQAANSRQGEFAADRYFLAHAGKETAAAALIHVTVTDRLPWVRLSSIAESAAVHNESLHQLFTEQMQRAQRVDPAQWEEACRKELAKPTGPFDSHPALRDRLKAIGVSPKKALKLALDQEGLPARALFPDWDALERKLTDRLVDLYREGHLAKMEVGQIILGRPIER